MQFNPSNSSNSQNCNTSQSTEYSKIQEETSLPGWEGLPHELLVKIFSELKNRQEFLNCSLTCKQWKVIANEKLELLAAENEKLNKLYTEMMINALGGFDAVYDLPELILQKRDTWEPLYNAGSIHLKKITAPIMRGLYYDGTPFITIRFSFEEDNVIHENALILHRDENYYSMTYSNGRIEAPFFSIDRFEDKDHFDALTKFIMNKQITEEKVDYKSKTTYHLTFKIGAP